jgi:hypothetical protein
VDLVVFPTAVSQKFQLPQPLAAHLDIPNLIPASIKIMTLPTYISSPPSHTLPSSPPTTHVLSSLPPDHLAAYEQAVEYYSDPEYRVGRKGLPSGAVGAVTGVHIGDGDEAKLTEDEMIFLVSMMRVRVLALPDG